MYLVEGLPAVLLGFVVLVYLTEKPTDAKWLEPEQREWLSRTMEAEQKTASERHRISLRETLQHPTVWHEMRRQRERIPALSALFKRVPEALAW